MMFCTGWNVPQRVKFQFPVIVSTFASGSENRRTSPTLGISKGSLELHNPHLHPFPPFLSPLLFLPLFPPPSWGQPSLPKPTGCLGESCKLPQRLKAEYGHQTIFGAFYAKKLCLCWQKNSAFATLFIARQHTDARYWYSNSVRLSVRLSVRPSVRLSVTLRYQMKTA